MQLHLVRHGRPTVLADHPSTDWPLHPEAGADIAALRAAAPWSAPAVWISSPESKARQTAELLTDAPVAVDVRLHEAVRHTWIDDADDFRRAVLTSFARPDHSAVDGWEPLSRTRDRLVAAVAAATCDHPADDVVLVGHGTAFTLLVASILHQPCDVAGWETMRMPDHWQCDLPARRVISSWGEVSPSGHRIAGGEPPD